jgi:acetoin utilization deacetylase AcuC-like enzyme
MDQILARMAEVGMTDIAPPRDFGLEPALGVHDARYLDFLGVAWKDWQSAGFKGEAIASSWPARRMQQRVPRDIDGRLGYYALAAETAISGGTWEAALISMNVALTAQEAVAGGARAAFALCRPPGHHAARDMYGGYCFINNAAVVAQAFLDQGATRVAILDVDFHHGNGTQDIFYDRGDVLFVSLHGAPEDAFPHFLGYADETGLGAGEGATLNLPLPPGTEWARWSEALEAGLSRVAAFGADALVVSFGADTFMRDPISFFKLSSDDFTRMGARLAGAGLPTVIVMEVGYAVSELGLNTVNLLQGFDGASG